MVIEGASRSAISAGRQDDRRTSSTETLSVARGVALDRSRLRRARPDEYEKGRVQGRGRLERTAALLGGRDRSCSSGWGLGAGDEPKDPRRSNCPTASPASGSPASRRRARGCRAFSWLRDNRHVVVTRTDGPYGRHAPVGRRHDERPRRPADEHAQAPRTRNAPSVSPDGEQRSRSRPRPRTSTWSRCRSTARRCDRSEQHPRRLTIPRPRRRTPRTAFVTNRTGKPEVSGPTERGGS